MAAASKDYGKNGSRSGAPRGAGSAVKMARLPALITFVALGVAALAGCGPGDDTSTGGAPSGAGGFGGSTGGDGGGGSGPCEDGATQDCHITLGQHGNVLSCFSGTQTCEGGQWGPCIGAQADHPAPPPPPAGPCQNNPCDPTCQVFDQVPAQPIGSPPQNLIAPWQVGNYGGLPPSLQAQVTGEPCSDGSACQVDQFCNNPSSNSCSHTKCVAGAGLQNNCDPCVKQVCIANPACCNAPIPGTGPCAHDLCATGVALTSGCDPCVTTICTGTVYSQCCNAATGAWTAECADRVANPTVCNKNCTSGTWSNSCVALVDTLCNAKCLADTTAPICAHDKCYLGDALDSACDPCVAQICADPLTASCCSGGANAWTGACLQAVASVCKQTCPAKGDCVPWLPTQKDPGCGGSWDLTIGVGCKSAGGVPSVPVCNRGQIASPAGLSLFADATGLPNAISPGLGSASLVTVPAIPAGACVNVNLPVATPDGALLVVNPGNAAGSGGVYNNAECHNNNNWGAWSTGTGTCAEPTCAGASAFSKLKKVKLFFSVDVSQSMSKSVVTGAINTEPSRWTYLKSALNGFMSSAPDDTAVWMRFWPNNSPDPMIGQCPQPQPTGCGPVPGCKNPNVDVGDLTAANETSVINTINTMVLTGVTPMFPALEAAEQRAIEFQQANPDWNAVVILVTDGNPTLCILTPSKIANLAGQAYQGYGVRTYTIGIAEVAEATVNQIAGAGGGKSFFISTNNAADFQSQLVGALNQIKNDFVSCTLPLPNQNIFDPTKALITYTTGAGAASNLPQVANAMSCAGDGWYYDNAANPTSLTLCPTTCTNVKLDTNGKLELKIDCIKQYLPSSTSETYAASCPAGTSVQWGWLGYDTTDPGDSSIVFSAQTSNDNVTFGALHPLATASTANNNQVCAVQSACRVDLFDKLGEKPDGHMKYLRLQADLKPTTDKLKTPTLNSWQVTYSCTDSE
ncbi:MAG: vWA domain-containing protein [Polyangiaceae bacterium]